MVLKERLLSPLDHWIGERYCLAEMVMVAHLVVCILAVMMSNFVKTLARFGSGMTAKLVAGRH